MVGELPRIARLGMLAAPPSRAPEIALRSESWDTPRSCRVPICQRHELAGWGVHAVVGEPLWDVSTGRGVQRAGRRRLYGVQRNGGGRERLARCEDNDQACGPDDDGSIDPEGQR
jgi:hypothetical protein